MRLQFKVELLLHHTELAPVWRRFLIPADWLFEELSDVIQVCMGWEFEHLWVFSNAAAESTEHIVEEEDADDYEGKTSLAYEVQLQDKFQQKGDTYFYSYDLEHEWTHRITLEEVVQDAVDNAELLDGTGACPPEDIGGEDMYAALVQTAAQPDFPDAYNFREILGLEPGQSMDLTIFDMATARERLANLNHLYHTYDETELEEDEDI